MLPLRILGIPVRISWSVAILALLGLGAYDGFALVMFAIGVVAAVLLHELGHALTARRFGAENITVTLYAFGGLTTFQPAEERPMSSFRLFLVAAAGSATGIVTGGALLLLIRSDAIDLPNVDIEALAWGFILAGLIWGVLNWLPIGPLDGAHMLRHFLDATVPSRAASIARVVSIIAGTATVLVAIAFDQVFLAVIAGVMTVSTLSEPAPARSEPQEAPAGGEPAGTGASGEGEDHDDADGAGTPPTIADERPAPRDPPSFPI